MGSLLIIWDDLGSDFEKHYYIPEIKERKTPHPPLF
jgi:hypothetical protein